MQCLHGYFFGDFSRLLGAIQPRELGGPTPEPSEPVVDDPRADFELPGQVLMPGDAGAKAGVKTLQSPVFSEKSLEFFLASLLAGAVLLFHKEFRRVGAGRWQ